MYDANYRKSCQFNEFNSSLGTLIMQSHIVYVYYYSLIFKFILWNSPHFLFQSLCWFSWENLLGIWLESDMFYILVRGQDKRMYHINPIAAKRWFYLSNIRRHTLKYENRVRFTFDSITTPNNFALVGWP